jgi:CRP-like cAMP-binding protein
VSETAVQERYLGLLQRSGETEEYEGGSTIFNQGDPADRMYVVVSGTVSMIVDGKNVETLGPGGLFGEMAVIEREPRSGSAVADTDATLVGIDKRRFWFLVQETPYFAEIVMRIMAARLRRQGAGI